jgi:hypothetical protein
MNIFVSLCTVEAVSAAATMTVQDGENKRRRGKPKLYGGGRG